MAASGARHHAHRHPADCSNRKCMGGKGRGEQFERRQPLNARWITIHAYAAWSIHTPAQDAGSQCDNCREKEAPHAPGRRRYPAFTG